jgi:hypothetical protein
MCVRKGNPVSGRFTEDVRDGVTGQPAPGSGTVFRVDVAPECEVDTQTIRLIDKIGLGWMAADQDPQH